MRDDRLSTAQEIKEVLSEKGAGLRLYHENGKDYFYDGEGHSMIIGLTGSGKTSCLTKELCASILKKGELLAAVDPKGDLYQATRELAKKEGYRIICINYRDLFRSDAYNPLSSVYDDYNSSDPVRREKAVYAVNDIVRSIINKKTQDPFWSRSAQDALRGLIITLLEYAKPEQVNFANIFHLINIGDRIDSKAWHPRTYLRELVDLLPMDSLISMNLLSYVTTANDTRGGIRSELLRGIAMFVQSKELMVLTSHDDLHLRSLTGKEKIAIYVILPDETDVYDELAGILMNDLIVHYEGIAHELYEGRLPIRLNIILEELANIGGSIPALPKLLAAGRSRNIRVSYVLQSIGQLRDVYDNKADSILQNTDITVMFRTNHIETLETMVKLCGEREVSYGNRVQNEHLFKLTDLAALPTGNALVRISGQVQYVAQLPFYQGKKSGKEEKAKVKSRRIYKPFDIRPIVSATVPRREEIERTGRRVPGFEEFMAKHDCKEEEEDD